MTWWHALQRDALLSLVRLLVGASPIWRTGALPDESPAAGLAAQKIWFANHTSHLDTLAILAALPRQARGRTRPVAARDYWDKDAPRRHIAHKLLNVVLIDRHRESGGDPLEPVHAALAEGSSIIIFPEGTRGAQALPQPFKGGLFHLAREFPHVPLAPVWLENLQRIMPKGALWPIPLICKVHFGAPQHRAPDEDRAAFLTRMHAALVALAPRQTSEDPESAE